MRHTIRTAFALATFCTVAAMGCDKEKTRDAAAKAGEGVEKAVVVVGDASHDAARTVGNAVETAGAKIKSASDRASTRPATTPAP